MITLTLDNNKVNALLVIIDTALKAKGLEFAEACLVLTNDIKAAVAASEASKTEAAPTPEEPKAE